MTAVTAPGQHRRRRLLPFLPQRKQPEGRAGVDRPRLLSDTSGSERVMLVAALAVGGFILGHIVRYDWAAIYYNITQTTETVNSAWHSFLSVDWQRHLARFGVEGLYTSAVVQAVFYGIKRWPPRAAGPWTRYVKRFLLVPSDKLPDQTLWCLALSWLWIIVWALPLGILITVILDYTHNGNTALTVNLSGVTPLLRSDVSLANWQQPLIGFVCGFIASRGIIKGTAFHVQRLIIKETLEAQHARGYTELRPPAWMGLFPYMKWRYQWSASRWQRGLYRTKGGAHVWRNAVAQRRFHVAMLALVCLFLLALTYQGWHVLTYLDWSFSHPFKLG